MGVLTHGNVRVTLPLAAAVPGGDPARRAGVEGFGAALPEAVAAVRAQLGTDRL
jgi:cysteine desulfurase